MPTEILKITFKVLKDGKKYQQPRWKKAEVENATCPECGRIMTVITGKTMYAHCNGCGNYFLAE